MLELQMTEERVLCARHGEPFKDRWPAAYPEFVDLAFDCLNHQEDFAAEVVRVAEGEDSFTQVDAVEYLLDQIPMCCRLTKDELYEVYHLANRKGNAWERRRCVLCDRKGYGSKYRRDRPRLETAPTTAPPGAVWDHVCLRCVTGKTLVRGGR